MRKTPLIIMTLSLLLLSPLIYMLLIPSPSYTRRAALLGHLSNHSGLETWKIDYLMWFVTAFHLLQSKELLPREEVLLNLQSHRVNGLSAYFIEEYPQVSDAYYVVSTLSILGELDLINVTEYAKWLGGLQEEDGGILNGYGVYMGWSPRATAYSTCWALLALKTLGRLDVVNVTRALDWLFNYCYNMTDGSFRPYPSYNGTALYGHYYGDPNLIFTTSLVVRTLCELDEIERLNITKTTDFFLTYYDTTSGAFSTYSDDLSRGNIEITFEALSALASMGTLEVIDWEKTINFILEEQKPNGAFSHQNYRNYRVDAKALKALQLLNALDRLEEPFPCFYYYILRRRLLAWRGILVAIGVAVPPFALFISLRLKRWKEESLTR